MTVPRNVLELRKMAKRSFLIHAWVKKQEGMDRTNKAWMEYVKEEMTAKAGMFS